MTVYRLKSALLPQAWACDAVVSVSDHGFITGIERAAAQTAAGTAIEVVDGVVVPGMANAHSHAFQRAMAGAAEYRASARDSFWTWRDAMYALANRVEPEDLKIIATQLFIEMLKSGYTSVAEFHYIHRRADGTPYQQSDEMWQAVDEAADVAGIAMTLLPTLYQSSDFGSKPLRAEQARFWMDSETYLRAVETRIAAIRRRGPKRQRIGAAFHSLRAVPLDALAYTAHALRAMDGEMPLHIHIAEQFLEVRSCLEATGRRPIELLLDQGLMDAQWCLVHATHATPAELQAIAQTGAAVCVSISTEANLGDGFFDSSRFLAAQGRLCIGSDSQSTVSPTEELRWMEYQQRLKRKRRGVLASRAEAHVGTRLWSEAARTGAQALGHSGGSIAVGARADWVVLDSGHPTMAGSRADSALDHLIFAGADAAIRDVMVAGRWTIKDGHHDRESEARSKYVELMRRFTAA